jgi:hypothetical protein
MQSEWKDELKEEAKHILHRAHRMYVVFASQRVPLPATMSVFCTLVLGPGWAPRETIPSAILGSPFHDWLSPFYSHSINNEIMAEPEELEDFLDYLLIGIPELLHLGNKHIHQSVWNKCGRNW